MHLIEKKTMKLLKTVFSSTDIEVTVISLNHEVEKKFKETTKNKRFKLTPPRKNILRLLGDSHLKGLQPHMQKNTPEELDLEIYPDGGANTKQILDNLNLITSDLEDDDYLVVVSGTNDLKFNDMGDCLYSNLYSEDMQNLISQARHTNILITGVPHRFDRPEANIHIDDYNCKLKDLIDEEKNNLNILNDYNFSNSVNT